MKDVFNLILAQIQNIKSKGSFAQNVSILMSGNLLNFVIQVVFSPIISRVFGPEAYGQYAYYNMIVINIVFLAGLGLPSVFIIPKTTKEFLYLAKCNLYNLLILLLLTLVVFAIFRSDIIDFEIGFFEISALVILILLSYFNGVMGPYLVRQKMFKRLTSVNVFSNFSTKMGVLTVGYLGLNTGIGLLIGDLFRSLVQFFGQSKARVRYAIIRWILKSSFKKAILTLTKHKRVPLYLFPSQLLNRFSGDLLLLVFGLYFDVAALGLYTFAVSMMNIPANLLENSIRPVLFQRASESYNGRTDSLTEIVIKTIKSSALLSIALSAGMAILSPLVFGLIFGEEWNQAGIIAAIISVRILFQSLNAPFLPIWRIIKKEKQLLFIDTIGMFLMLSSFLVLPFGVSLESYLIILSILIAIGQIICILSFLYYINPNLLNLKRVSLGIALFATYVCVVIIYIHVIKL